MRTRNPPKLIMNTSLIMQLIMSCLVFQCAAAAARRLPHVRVHTTGLLSGCALPPLCSCSSCASFCLKSMYHRELPGGALNLWAGRGEGPNSFQIPSTSPNPWRV